MEEHAIAEGTQVKVFIHPENPAKVIKKSKESAILPNALEIEGCFHLTKVLNGIFPSFIPDIHAFVGDEKSYQIEMDRILFDGQYHKFLDAYAALKLDMTNPELLHTFEDQCTMLQSRIDGDGRINRTMNQLKTFGIDWLDRSIGNIAYDHTGQPVYVDLIRPWGSPNHMVDVQQLEAEISLLPADQQLRLLPHLFSYRSTQEQYLLMMKRLDIPLD